MSTERVWGVFRLRGVKAIFAKRRYKARQIHTGEWAVIEHASARKGTSITQKVVTEDEFARIFAPVDGTARGIMPRDTELLVKG